MSRAATDWAWKVKSKSSSHKLLLLALADRADEYHCCYPSIKRLEKDTQLNRKTIGDGINQMIEDGLITDTGERKGPTKRVRVLCLNVEGEHTQKRNDTENGNITKNGTLNDPKNGMLNVPENGTLNDPKNGIQNQSLESVNEPVIESFRGPDPATQNYLKRMGMNSPSEIQIPFPINFTPNAENQSIALEKGVNVQEELIKFRDHAESVGAKKQSWHKAFNNWLRNARPAQIKPTHQSAIQVTKSGYVFIN